MRRCLLANARNRVEEQWTCWLRFADFPFFVTAQVQPKGISRAAMVCVSVKDQMRARGNNLRKSSATIVRSFKLAK